MTGALGRAGRDDRSSLAGRALARAHRFLEPGYRRSLWIAWRGARGVFQPDNTTWEDRYPRIFSFVQSQLGEQTSVRVLSFGCSTGEEVFSLRRLLPGAAVRGLDINPGNVETSLRRLRRRPDPLTSFAVAASTEAEPAEAYDAIFCMAVLRDSRLTRSRLKDCSRYIRFADFARITQDFHRCLKPGGLLAIRHANFRLCDAPVGASFEVALSLPVTPQSYSPIFGCDNRLMPGVAYGDNVFRKRNVGSASETGSSPNP